VRRSLFDINIFAKGELRNRQADDLPKVLLSHSKGEACWCQGDTHTVRSLPTNRNAAREKSGLISHNRSDLLFGFKAKTEEA